MSGKGAQEQVRLTEIYFENIKPFANFRLIKKESTSLLMCGEYEGVGKTADILCTLLRLVINKADRTFIQHSKRSDHPTAVVLKEEWHATKKSVYYGLFGWQGSAYYFRYNDGIMEFIDLDLPDKVFKKDLIVDDRWDRPEICDRYRTMILSLIVNLIPEKGDSLSPQQGFTIPVHTTFRDGEQRESSHEGDDHGHGRGDDSTKARLPKICGKKDEHITNASDVLIINDVNTSRKAWMEYELFATRYVMDGSFESVIVVPITPQKCSFREIKANLVILVEGKEDQSILEKLIEKYKIQVNNPVLRNMLDDIRVKSLDGKGNLKNKVASHLKSSIIHVFVLDQDALYVDLAAEDVKDCYSENILPNERKYTPVSPSDEQTHVSQRALSKAPVMGILDLNIKKDTHYFQTKTSERITKYMKESRVASSALRKCIEDDEGLTYGDYIEFLQKELCIFTWKKPDGTSSGALGLDKQAVINKVPEVNKKIEKLVKEKHEESNRFENFLTDDVFKSYNRFNHNMSKETVFTESQMLEEIHGSEGGVIKISWLPKTEIYNDESFEDVLKTAAEKLDSNLRETLWEAKKVEEFVNKRQTGDSDDANRSSPLGLEREETKAVKRAEP